MDKVLLVFFLQEKNTLLSALPFSINHHTPNTLPPPHQLKPIIDLFKRQHVGDQVVDINPPVHVPIHDPRHVGAAAGAAEGGAHPGSPGDEL